MGPPSPGQTNHYWSEVIHEPEALWKQFLSYFEQRKWHDGQDLMHIGNDVRRSLEDSPFGVQAIQIMADAAGSHPELRPKYEEFGVLYQCAQAAFTEGKSKDLTKQYLRVVGNSLDEQTGKCRKVVLSYLPKLSNFFHNPDLAPIAIGLAMNLCAEPGPESEYAVELGFDAKVASGLWAGLFPENSPGCDRAISFLENISDDLPRNLSTVEPLITLNYLIQAMTILKDLTVYARCAAITVKYLENDTVRRAIANDAPIFNSCMDVLVDNDRRVQKLLDLPEATRREVVQDIQEELFDFDDAAEEQGKEVNLKLVQQLVSTESLGKALVLLSQEDTYKSTIAEVLPECELMKLVDVIRSETSSVAGVHIMCACLMLANMASNTSLSERAVQEMDVHRAVLNIITPATDRNILRAAAQCLFRLAESSLNRPTLGTAGVLEACACLLYLKDPRISPEAASVIKRLLTDTPANIPKVFSGISETSRRHIREWQWKSDLTQPLPPTLLGIITSIYASNTDVADLAVAVVEVVKIACKPHSEALTNSFFDVALHEPETVTSTLHPLFKLAQNDPNSYPCRRGLFALGLLTHHQPSAECVMRYLDSDADALDNLERLVGAASANISVDKASQSEKSTQALKSTLSVILFGLQTNVPEHKRPPGVRERVNEMFNKVTK
ncbi:hypothetical protein EJ05DRAFT_497499 [Pseudovirgaria hyperparasitica]|uniref:ARM repeat-containing protein n=1 Tax=Pseudovirgaria hyperparasitica TaxID=470096 RepID=A0A6A6WFI8_9PEZI|nr:uncharacterized protein EJ05DRAFT_497499 [Pseudovirgaria hyperparasitica]KAF2760929.1 hypothetical protein EJ05DRAFT_497499 [Pseudovirgaria hyperparasitica]